MGSLLSSAESKKHKEADTVLRPFELLHLALLNVFYSEVELIIC